MEPKELPEPGNELDERELAGLNDWDEQQNIIDPDADLENNY
jgi:hypothetical protein